MLMYTPETTPLRIFQSVFPTVEENVIYETPDEDKESMRENFRQLKDALAFNRPDGQIRWLKDIVKLYRRTNTCEAKTLKDALDFLEKDYCRLADNRMLKDIENSARGSA